MELVGEVKGKCMSKHFQGNVGFNLDLLPPACVHDDGNRGFNNGNQVYKI